MPRTKTKTTDTVERLLDEYGNTYAEEAGVSLRDTPTALYQLLVVSLLSATRIRAEIAVTSARELFRAGLRTPKAMAGSRWQDRVDALGRGGYRRYDESTATSLGRGAELIGQRWNGNLRRLRREADGKPPAIRRLLKELPGIGDTGADIFCREAQGCWPELRPYFDRRARRGATQLDLPGSPDELAGLAPTEDLPRFAAALVRVSLDRDAPDRLRAAPSPAS